MCHNRLIRVEHFREIISNNIYGYKQYVLDYFVMHELNNFQNLLLQEIFGNHILCFHTVDK